MKLPKPKVIRPHKTTEDYAASSGLAFSLVSVLAVVLAIVKLYFSFTLEG